MTKALGLDIAILCSFKWLALNNPQDSDDKTRNDQTNDCSFQWTNECSSCGDTHGEQAYRYFSEHKSCKGLEPFSITIFPKFTELVLADVGLRSSEAFVNCNKV